MRIIEVISGLGQGGAERALAARLGHAPADMETHVVTTSAVTSSITKKIKAHAKIHTVRRAVTHSIADLQPDLVITHNPREAVRLLGNSTFASNHPIVVVAHNEITSEYPIKAVPLTYALTRVNSRAALHIAVSSRAALGTQCRNARRVVVCLLGASVDSTAQPRPNLWPGWTEKRVLVLGRFSPQKNLESLLDAASTKRSLLLSRKAHILLVGDGQLRGRFERRIRENQLQQVITITGWIDPPDPVLAAADTLFIPSRNEGGPLVLYEGLLSGTRVMSTPVGAAPDLLTDDPHLVLMKDSSARSLTQGLEVAAELKAMSSDERSTRAAAYSHLATPIAAASFYDSCLQALDN